MTSVETVSALERRLNASIPQQDIRGVVSARLKNIGRNAKIAGFRPGKVPAKVIEKHYGAQVHQEALGEAMQRSFQEAALSNNLRVAGSPQFEIKSNDPNADQIEYSATFEVYPEVVMGDLSGVAIERLVYQVKPTDVENMIVTLRKQRATFVKVDRAAQNEDRVLIDFSGKLDGAAFEGGEGKGVTVVLGMGRMLPDFEAAIIGMKPNETKTFDMKFPEDYHGKNVAGKKVTFTVTLHRVEAAKLPDVDAEFAKSIGVTDGDVSKLEAEIRTNLTREVARRLKLRNKETAMEALLKIANFDVPRGLVDLEVQTVMQKTAQEMASRDMKMKDKQFQPEMFKARAEKRVKLGLILSDAVQRYGLQARPEQTKAMIEDYAQGFDEAEQIIRWYAADPKRMIEVENLVLEENMVDWVMGRAKTTDKMAEFNDLMESS
ncbi:MAG: trigger factor [Gallionella sp.]